MKLTGKEMQRIKEKKQHVHAYYHIKMFCPDESFLPGIYTLYFNYKRMTVISLHVANDVYNSYFACEMQLPYK